MIICLIFILNYYNTHYQYKCAIVMIWGYGILYLQYGATLHVSKGLIKNSVIFKIVKISLSLPSYQWSVPQGAQSPQTLYYIILYYITLFYGFNTLVFCNLHCIYIILYYIYFMASGVKSGVYCYLHCIYIYIYFCHFANGGAHVVLYKALNPL